MLRNEVLALMEALKLRGMQEVYDELLASGRKQRAIPEKVVLELLKANGMLAPYRSPAAADYPDWTRPDPTRPATARQQGTHR